MKYLLAYFVFAPPIYFFVLSLIASAGRGTRMEEEYRRRRELSGQKMIKEAR